MRVPLLIAMASISLVQSARLNSGIVPRNGALVVESPDAKTKVPSDLFVDGNWFPYNTTVKMHLVDGV